MQIYFKSAWSSLTKRLPEPMTYWQLDPQKYILMDFCIKKCWQKATILFKPQCVIWTKMLFHVSVLGLAIYWIIAVYLQRMRVFSRQNGPGFPWNGTTPPWMRRLTLWHPCGMPSSRWSLQKTLWSMISSSTQECRTLWNSRQGGNKMYSQYNLCQFSNESC